MRTCLRVAAIFLFLGFFDCRNFPHFFLCPGRSHFRHDYRHGDRSQRRRGCRCHGRDSEPGNPVRTHDEIGLAVAASSSPMFPTSRTT